MKKKLAIIALLITITGFSQNINDTIYKLSEVDKKPEFEGGITNLYKFVASKYKTLDKRKFQGKIIIEFVVERDGSLTNFNSLSDFGFGSGDETIRVLKLSPIWIPGEKNGKVVRTYYEFPLTIRKGD